MISDKYSKPQDLEQKLLNDSNASNAQRKNCCALSNFTMLFFITSFFALFVIAEIIGALASNSLSLLGDAAAMSVDVFTYGANMWAERTKAKYGDLDKSTRYYLEVYIPTFSICGLLAVTVWIASEAVQTVMDPEDDGEEVDIIFLYAFAGVNMLIDIISTFFFYQSRDTVFLHTRISRMSRISGTNPSGAVTSLNLNMYSAFTHVGGDTFRTLSVLICAVIAATTNFSSTLCDAWAAIAVTLSICALVVPLMSEIYKAHKDLGNMK
jgi:Co/Zn/Cd efflux system component